MSRDRPVQELVDLVGRGSCAGPDIVIIGLKPCFDDRTDHPLVEFAEPPRDMPESDKGITPNPGVVMSGKTDAHSCGFAVVPGEQGDGDRDERQFIR